MTEMRDNNRRGPSLAKALTFIAALMLCLFALAYFLFFMAIETVIVQPLEDFGQWIDSIEAEDHGGDDRITLPPVDGQTP